MTVKLHGVLSIIIFISVFGVSFNFQDSYTAAVVSYMPTYRIGHDEDNGQFPEDVPFPSNKLLSVNFKCYQEIMRNASQQDVDIIVFPEFGIVNMYILYALTHSENGTNLLNYSTFIPDPKLEITPCDEEETDTLSMDLINISCAARTYNMYTVFNLPEKAYNNETEELEFYNTDVVLDRYGTIIARYRKIHLSEELFFTPGDELVTFETDFGVTFGIFTCFDILFKYPALDVLLLPNVTDIIFSMGWSSRTPFLQSLSISHGYVKANGVNLLASCVQEPFNYDGGSAIILADGTIAELQMSNNRETKVIIQEVPIIKNKIPASTCTCNKNDITKKEIQTRNEESIALNNIDDFPITRANLSEYVFEPIDESPTILKQICSEDKKFCCTFNITIDEFSPAEPDYTYMLAAFDGVTKLESKVIGGIRICALLACLNESDSNTCGYKTSTSLTSIKFKNIDIVTIIDKTSDAYYQPATLRNDLTPTSEYTYCETEINKGTQIKVTMNTTAPQESLDTFGIYGRVYGRDVALTSTSSDNVSVTESPPSEETTNSTDSDNYDYISNVL